MKAFIVWSYDDGIIGGFETKGAAEVFIEYCHENDYYHREDVMIKELEISDKSRAD